MEPIYLKAFAQLGKFEGMNTSDPGIFPQISNRMEGNDASLMYLLLIY